MKHSEQHGMALVMVLLLVAMATTLAVFMAQQQAFWQRALENGRDRAQARRIAEAGVDWARAVLADDASVSQQYDHSKEMWAMRLPAIQLEGGEVRGAIFDQQGLYNLNNLVRYGAPHLPDIVRYRRLLDTLGLPQDLAATLIDWLDSNAETTANGAEDDYYLSQGRPYRCANRLLSDIGELAWVKGYDAGVIQRLQPYVSVLPESNTALNVNFASPEVLHATIDGLSLQDARQIVQKIEAEPYRNIMDFMQQLPRSVKHNGSLNLSVSSKYFMVTGYATQGDGASTVHALLRRDGYWASQVSKGLQ